ncbi:elongator complex protein 4 [Polypterus senegalus]|uniref:elongator complex protein 4 n=1 Tax=Polypterus senegalus TaxID=55291 RepID=UPI001966AA66|nr:elongator complex protein 4 [Polypterus senegalus]
MAIPVQSMTGISNARLNVEMNTTSFQKKSRSKLLSIPGTRPSFQNGQLLVSTGTTSLDYVIGGGLAVGTLMLIEEDVFDSYSHMLLKYFLAEGIVCSHSVLIASAGEHPDDILQGLPAPVLDDVPKEIGKINQRRENDVSEESQDSMKIAWRYQNQPKVQTVLAASSRFGHYYDASKQMSAETFESAEYYPFYLPAEVHLKYSVSSNIHIGYIKLLRFIQGVIHKEGFDRACPQSKTRNILRIGIHSLGSVLWGDDICCKDDPLYVYSLTKFLYGLRGLLRTSLSVCMVTVPSHLIQNKTIMGRVTNLCDTVIGIKSFNGSEKDANDLYKDYHGLVCVKKIPCLNSLICELPDSRDLAFKLKRKQFTIERLHLPPDLSDTVSRLNKQDLAESSKLLRMGCGAAATGKKHLDF